MAICDKLKELFHRHDMEKVAHWCDKECSVIIVEYKCSKCGHEEWDFVYFDDARCEVLKRIPVELSNLEAPKLAECGKSTCEQTINTEDGKNSRKRRSSDAGRTVESGTEVGKKKPATKRQKT